MSKGLESTTFTEYAELAQSTAIYPGSGTLNGLLYVTLGLAGESGEVAEKVKKLLRDRGGVIDSDFRDALKKEVGDVLWYLTMLCKELGISLDDVARTNVEKLSSRANKNLLQGSGDNREEEVK